MALQINYTGFEQKLLFNNTPFFAQICENEGDLEECNVIIIKLDASERSFLHTKAAEERAEQAMNKGLLILWELDFKLLEGPLEEECRFLTLQLNVQHFNDTLFKTFQEHTFGVALFRGEPKPAVIDTLKALGASVSDALTLFVFLDTAQITSFENYFQLTNPECLGHIVPLIKGPFAEKYPWMVPSLGWSHGNSSLGYCSSALHTPLQSTPIKYAICLPAKPHFPDVQHAIDTLYPHPFRIIPESLLTQMWDGIDFLIIFGNQTSEQSLRKFRGFVAAGGVIIDCLDDASFWLNATTR